MNLDSDILILIGAQLTPLLAVWTRLEHRLTKLETHIQWMNAGHHRPTDRPTPGADISADAGTESR